MTNEELIAKIKAEIEGRIEIYIGNAQSCINTTLVDGLHEALDVLSALESEKPMELEEEINRYLEPIHTADIQFEPFTQMTKCARHFAEWGYLRAAEKYNEIEYNRQRAEECVSDDLEEAANEHINNIAYCGDDIELEKEQSKRDFTAGAKWQKQHDAELIEIAYNDGITIGMTKQKDQMMKEAVEADVNIYRDLAEGESWAEFVVAKPPKNLGDKVRIIVIPNTDKK